MLDLAFRNLKDHKLRSFLTILGIIIAIMAVVSLGSISEGLRLLVEEQLTFASEFIVVTEEGLDPRGPPPSNIFVDLDVLEVIKNMDGVDIALPILFRQEKAIFVLGFDLDERELFELAHVEPEEGRYPNKGEKALIIGTSVPRIIDLSLGDTFSVNNEDLEIVGILEDSGSSFDFSAFTSFETAQNVFDQHDSVSEIIIKPTDPSAMDKIKNEIEDEFDNLEVYLPADSQKIAEETLGTVRNVTLGIGIVSSLIAAVGIINTMFMAVTQKRKQLGIMKAIGATKRQILMQVIEESFVMAVIGGLVGVGVGFYGTAIVNSLIGVPIAKVTPVLALSSFSFGIVLTLVSAYYPAYLATQIDAVKAIRS